MTNSISDGGGGGGGGKSQEAIDKKSEEKEQSNNSNQVNRDQTEANDNYNKENYSNMQNKGNGLGNNQSTVAVTSSGSGSGSSSSHRNTSNSNNLTNSTSVSKCSNNNSNNNNNNSNSSNNNNSNSSNNNNNSSSNNNNNNSSSSSSNSSSSSSNNNNNNTNSNNNSSNNSNISNNGSNSNTNNGKMVSKSSYNGKSNSRSISNNQSITSPLSGTQTITPQANAFLGTAAMISPYMNMNAAVARIHQATAAAACMSPYMNMNMNLRYPSSTLAASAAAAAASTGNPYSVASVTPTTYHHHHQIHPGHGVVHGQTHSANLQAVSGHSLYQASRMPASSPPVSSSGASGSSSSQGSSTSGLGSSASSSSTSGVGGNGPSAGTASSNANLLSSSNYEDQLSRTNLYIKGLMPNTSDKDLFTLCAPYGNIISTKAILDKNTNKCKGYGFVDFESPVSAEAAVKTLQSQGVLAQMARCTDTSRGKNASVIASNSVANYAAVTNNSSAVATSNYSSSVYTSNRTPQQEQDPTNLYIANLPSYMTETELEAMLNPHGSVISTRILKDDYNQPRGVGFARMESKEKCDMIIQKFNGQLIPGCKEPLLVKFADGGNKKKILNKNENRWREGTNDPIPTAYAYPADQANLTQNGVAAAQLMPSIAAAAAAGYHHPHQRQYSTSVSTYPAAAAAAIQAAAAASATQWMHTGAAQYHLVPSPAHMQSAAAQMIPSQPIDTNALHFSTIMPQLTASLGQIQLSSHPYMAGAPAAAYAPGAATSGALYATQPGTPIIQQMALAEPGDANHPSSGTSSVGPAEELGQTNTAHHYPVYTPK